MPKLLWLANQVLPHKLFIQQSLWVSKYLVLWRGEFYHG
jgi:hypothetical protein